MWKKAYIVFFNDGIIYWAGIFIGISNQERMIRNRFNYDKTLSENSNQELSKVQSPIGSQYSRTGCRICLFFIIPLLDTL